MDYFKTIYLPCTCYSPEHLMQIHKDLTDGTIYINVLSMWFDSWWKRVFKFFKYMIGIPSYEDGILMLNERECEQLEHYLENDITNLKSYDEPLETFCLATHKNVSLYVENDEEFNLLTFALKFEPPKNILERIKYGNEFLNACSGQIMSHNFEIEKENYGRLVALKEIATEIKDKDWLNL
jgi:hypothetical protein